MFFGFDDFGIFVNVVVGIGVYVSDVIFCNCNVMIV